VKADALYSTLLRLYPSTFHREYHTEMLGVFRELDRAHQNRRLRFWALILSDFVRSDCREWADSLKPHVSWILAFVGVTFLGWVLFFGLHRAYDALVGPCPIGARLVVRGALVGLGLGWAQYAVLGRRLTARSMWLLPSLAGGIATFPLIFAVVELMPAIARELPEHPAPDSVTAGTIGLTLLVTSLTWLRLLGRRHVVVAWLRINLITLPAVILANVAMLGVRELTFPERSWLEPLSVAAYMFMNPLVVAIAVGALTARPVWHRFAAGKMARPLPDMTERSRILFELR
jgi:hypothetical protein